MYKKTTLVIVLFLILLSLRCASTVFSAKPERLQKNNPMAIAELKIDFAIKESTGQKVRNRIEGLLNSFVFLKKKDSGKESSADSMKRILKENINKNFLRKGFTPIERERVDQILKEIAFQHSGLTDEKRIELGKLLGARSLFFGKVFIEIEEGPLDSGCIDSLTPFFRVSDINRITFSGRLVSVRAGSILISGDLSTEIKGELQLEFIRELIDAWFDDVPVL